MVQPAGIVFMGTPDFAVPSLKALFEAGYSISAVVTQPDRPTGRGRRLTAPPVKTAAMARGIEVIQPARMRAADFIERLKALKPDFIVTAAFGKILPIEILNIPKKGSVNLHASLLPRYRGAAPINRAIINGDKETGVCTMLMDAGMDTGPVLLSEKVAIGDDDTALDLSKKLSTAGAVLLVKTIEQLTAGSIEPTAQDGSQATYAPSLKKTEGLIDWERDAREVRNLVRGMYPWPGTSTRWRGRLLKIHSARVSPEDHEGSAPGTVVFVRGDSFGVKCANGVLEVTEVQPENKKRMDTGSFIKGYRIKEGERLVF